MIKTFGQSDPRLAQYAVDTFNPEDSILKEIRERSIYKGLPDIQVGMMDALHLEVLVYPNGWAFFA